MNTQSMRARRAIESLRSGVPNKDVVAELGTTQNEISTHFEQSIESCSKGDGNSPMLLSATFGAGKTHLLNYLQSIAEREGFVTSYVVISPEMPLGNPHLVLKAIAENAHAPGRAGRALRSLNSELSSGSAAISTVSDWIRDSEIDDRFRALLRLYDAFRPDEEFRQQILGDFEGRPILKSIIKNRLRQINEAKNFDLSGPRAALVAHDRIRLLAQLFKSCGYGGWIVLFDEMERVAKFSLAQRISAYSELGWWRRAAETGGSSLFPVFTTASGFVAETVTGGSRDEQLIDRSSSASKGDLDAAYGIDFLKSPLRLDSPSHDEETVIIERVRKIYEQAYNVSVGDLSSAGSDARISVRSEIRRWITLWDLRRYYPTYDAEVQIEDLHFDPSAIGDEIIDLDE